MILGYLIDNVRILEQYVSIFFLPSFVKLLTIFPLHDNIVFIFALNNHLFKKFKRKKQTKNLKEKAFYISTGISFLVLFIYVDLTVTAVSFFFGLNNFL